MIQRRYASFSTLVISPLVQAKFTTGKGFGGSNLKKIVQFQELVVPISGSSAMISDDPVPMCDRQSSLLVIQVGKIALLTCWFWYLIGVNFCANSMSAIAHLSAARTD